MVVGADPLTFQADYWKEGWEKENNTAGEMNMDIELGWKKWVDKEANKKGAERKN